MQPGDIVYRYFATVGAFLLLAPFPALAQERPRQPTTISPKSLAPTTFNEATFVAKASSGGIHEVEMGKLALAHASNGEVKKFGQMMVDDHSKANRQLMIAAKENGLSVATKMSADQEKHYDLLKDMREGFDKAYIDHMVKDHEEDLAAFTAASRQAKTPAIKQFATDTIPVIQKHLDRARELQKIVK